jgi:hypothetical protein
VGVTSGSEDLKDTVLDREERDIKGSTSKVVDNDLRLGLAGAVKTVGNGSGGGLVDNTENVEAGNGSGVTGSGALSVVEVWSVSNEQEANNSYNLQAGTVTTAWVTFSPR